MHMGLEQMSDGIKLEGRIRVSYTFEVVFHYFS